MPFQFQRLQIPDVILVQVSGQPDARGFFRETYRQAEFAAHGIPPFVQDNHSRSMRGVLRGLHYQKEPHAQGKFLIVARGEIFDVAVDIRKGSPTYGKWVGEILSAENGRMLYVPPGFAHGFCVLSDMADVLYKVTAEYAPESERGIRWNDPAIGIDWHYADPILNSRDSQAPLLRDADNNFVFK
ncbi:MAG: dTDP-4-dehydrorhamnose 3,5-epimerase [Chloroflexi bacterium]|nr:dTDP-4-dehydrorhamnose 3,5-epimerase [Chloroflexota bacterium]